MFNAIHQANNNSFVAGVADGGFVAGAAEALRKRAEALRDAMRLTPLVTAACKADLASLMERKAADIVAAAEGGCVKQLYDAVKWFCGKTRCAPAMLVQAADGTPAGDKVDQAQNVMTHMRLLMGGHFTTFAKHLEADRRLQRDLAPNLAAVERTPCAVVGILDLQVKLSRATCGKTFGPAQVPTEVCRVAPSEIARLYDPIVVKTALSLEGSLQWRGADIGTLVEDALQPQPR